MASLSEFFSDPSSAGRWTLVPDQSTISVKAKSFWGVVPVKGRFTEFSGDGQIAAPQTVFGRLDIKAGSLKTGIGKRDEHMYSADFFDAENHPHVTFDSTLVRAENGELTVDGEVTINGITRPIVARGTLTEPHVTFGDLEKVGLELEAVIDRTQYGLNWNAPLPKGGFALGNDVKLQVNLELAKAE